LATASRPSPSIASWAAGPDSSASRRSRSRSSSASAGEVDGREEPVVREQHLGLAQEQQAGRVERVVQPAEDARLRLGGEVHEGVAAQQQVDVRDRCVLDQVVAAEDHRPAEVLAEGEPAVLRREVRLHLRGAQPGQLPLGVDGLPGVRQRLLVDVRGVDLDPLAELVGAEGVGQQDGQAVGLLARCAAGAPHPDDRTRRGEQAR
jgi:hypothetical protein